MGRLSQRVGDVFEDWIDEQHTLAERRGVLAAGTVVHNQAKTKVVGGNLIYSRAGVSDYTAMLDRTGRHFAVEAKSTKEDRLGRSAIEPTQVIYLDGVARGGGLALLLIEFRSPCLVRVAVPWLQVPWEILRSAETVGVQALVAWYIEPDSDAFEKKCYLEKFHSQGTPTSVVNIRRRKYAR